MTDPKTPATREELPPTKPKVRVHTIRYHTHDGQEHEVGDEYEVDEDQADNLRNLGMAHRTDISIPKHPSQLPSRAPEP